jgi:hypothetical protein
MRRAKRLNGTENGKIILHFRVEKEEKRDREKFLCIKDEYFNGNRFLRRSRVG